jgi:MoaD family protein
MRIKVKGFLTIQKAMGDQGLVVVERETATLKILIEELCARYGKVFKDLVVHSETNAVMDHNQILVNGKHYRFLPEGMDTALHDGDTVVLIPPVVGG